MYLTAVVVQISCLRKALQKNGRTCASLRLNRNISLDFPIAWSILDYFAPHLDIVDHYLDVVEHHVDSFHFDIVHHDIDFGPFHFADNCSFEN